MLCYVMPNLVKTILIAGGSSVIAFILGIIVAYAIFKKRAKKGADTVSEVVIKNGTRYTKDDSVIVSGNTNVTHNEGDIILERSKEYTVRKGGRVMPGKYTVLTADGSNDSFNMRVAGFVRELSHNTDLVLAEGDKICAVSHTVVLR